MLSSIKCRRALVTTSASRCLWSLAKRVGRRILLAIGGYAGIAVVCLGISRSSTAVEQGTCPAQMKQAREKAQRIAHEWPLRGHDVITEYVQDLGMRLVAGDHRTRSTPWGFHVVRDYSVNAFAIGGGYIYVTEGAVRFAETEDELAAILAHEVAHDLSGHFCSRSAQRGLSNPLEWFSAEFQTVERIGVGSLTQVIDIDREIQADRAALDLLRGADYDPRAMLAVARRLPSTEVFLHLKDRRRLRSLERLLAEVTLATPRYSQAFQRIKIELGPP